MEMIGKAVADNSFTTDRYSPVTYDDFLQRARTGDILLAASREMSSLVTRVYSAEPWTHVGLVCRTKLDRDEIRVLEFSGHNPTEEVYQVLPRGENRLGDGVGLYDLDDFFFNSGGIYWRPLRLELAADEKKVSWAISSMLRHSGQRFCGTVEVVSSNIFGTHFADGVVCSTVVALALHSAGVIKLQKNVSLYVPSDFARDDIWNLTVPPGGPYCVFGYASKSVSVPPALPRDFCARNVF